MKDFLATAGAVCNAPTVTTMLIAPNINLNYLRTVMLVNALTIRLGPTSVISTD